MNRMVLAKELVKIARTIIAASSVQGELAALNQGGSPFKYLKIGDKFSFKKDGDVLIKVSDRSYQDSKGRKFQTGKHSTTFGVNTKK